MALDDGDHHLRELLIIKSKRENDVVDYTTKTMDQLKDMISKRKGYLSTLRFKDNGDKLKTIRICEAELQRRRNNNHKVFNTFIFLLYYYIIYMFENYMKGY
ncbi:hypothetical protein HanIR_Chr12g0586171 [Helianthus annuus]|nr:hypothetical protein HanIR_Chr12g0586171 [Helianthus annuus]